MKVTSVKFSDEMLRELLDVAAQMGPGGSLSAVIKQAVAYGLPVVREELGMDLVVPKSHFPEKKLLVSVAGQIFQKGLDQFLQPGGAAQ